MGVYVKGLEMPKVCAECPFREVRYDPGYYNYEHCKALGKIFNEHSLEIDVFEEKFNDCPLIEIPTPHGRLIDADKLKEKRETMCWKDEFYMTHESDFIDSRHIDNAPTILEAEE